MGQQDGTEKDHAVSEVHVHERYNSPKQFNNDIALMKLAKPVDFSGPYAGPACLPPAGKDYQMTWNCFMTGWGLTDPLKHKSFANTLQKLKSYTIKNRWLTLMYHS